MTQTKALNALHQTIVACCTAPGKGALGVIRLSGPDARAIAHKAASVAGKNNLLTTPTHTIVYGFVCNDQGDHLDQVLFLVMDGPRTFTGEHVVEVTCHNNPFVINTIIERFIQLGAVQAQPGEFTQRAVENNKLDLLQAEALHDLITAPSHASAKASLAQLEGSLSHSMTQIEADLVSLASLVEASFEFSEEEHIDLDFDRLVRSRLADIQNAIHAILATQHSVTQLREGVRIALVGTVNAGKSTLMNALLGTERAIVSDQAGTTRDSIEASMSNGQHSWTFIDTAGLRETVDHIEKEGITRSYDAAQRADIVCIVVDGSRLLSHDVQAYYDNLLSTFQNKACVVYTKSELGDELSFSDVLLPAFRVSAQTGQSMDVLQNFIAERVAQLYTSADTPFVLNARHLAILKEVQKSLELVVVNTDAAVLPYEIVAAQLQQALELLTQLTGHSVTKKVMDTVFSTFCIGK